MSSRNKRPINQYTSQFFETLMCQIWGHEDSPLMDTYYVGYHNAVSTARALGAKVGKMNRPEEDGEWLIATFRDGSTAELSADGGGINGVLPPNVDDYQEVYDDLVNVAMQSANQLAHTANNPEHLGEHRDTCEQEWDTIVKLLEKVKGRDWVVDNVVCIEG